MFDEMYLQKATQNQGGGYVGVDEKRNAYKRIVAFIVAGLKQKNNFLLKSYPQDIV